MARYIDIHTHRPTTATTIRTAGIHPWHAADSGIAAELEQVAGRALRGEIDAVGEIGLDKACAVNLAQQTNIFEQQLLIAAQHRLPVVLHCVRAFEPVMQILACYAAIPTAIFHGFVGSAEQAARAVGRGHYISVGELSLRSQRTRNTIMTVPQSNIFVETDDSDTSVESIYREVAHLRGVSVEELAQAIEQNYNRIFNNNER